MTLDYPPRTDRALTGAALAALFAVLRGLWAVARLLAGALAALTSAAIGTPPASATRLRHLIADEYRAGRVGAIDAEVIEDTTDPDTEPHAEPVKENRP
ncbi:hypothetical protein [Spirillospora albida]|uniref:hypothetical protein n=1 Tax=Spirillospora albida TaxID=58123 RepID=UPI0004BEBA0B|nr:hypothetical protein [Spirillospora albida]